MSFLVLVLVLGLKILVLSMSAVFHSGNKISVTKVSHGKSLVETLFSWACTCSRMPQNFSHPSRHMCLGVTFETSLEIEVFIIILLN